jgi:hypothetical protein
MDENQTQSSTAPRNSDAARRILELESSQIAPETQEQMNKPTVSSEEMRVEDEKFLNLLLDLIARKQIDLFRPSTLLNEPIYEKLTPEQKAQAELDSLNLLSTIKEIKKLFEAKMTDTYQFQNKLQQLRLTKERIESQIGDVYII